jgi:hypothetical protein
VTDAGKAGGGLFTEETGEFVNATGLLAELELSLVERAEAGRVVAAIFEPAEAFDEDGLGRFFADVADNATHDIQFSEAALRRFNRPGLRRGSAAMANHNSVSFHVFVFIADDEERVAVGPVIVN